MSCGVTLVLSELALAFSSARNRHPSILELFRPRGTGAILSLIDGCNIQVRARVRFLRTDVRPRLSSQNLLRTSDHPAR